MTSLCLSWEPLDTEQDSLATVGAGHTDIVTHYRFTQKLDMLEFAELKLVRDTNNEEDEADMDDWKEIFARLDPKDGTEDGRICKVAFLEWIDTLNFQDTVMLEVSQGISRLVMVCIELA